MNHHSHRYPVRLAGVRDGLCAAIAIVVTVSLSWSFVHSTQSLRWMGSDEVGVVQAPGQDDQA